MFLRCVTSSLPKNIDVVARAVAPTVCAFQSSYDGWKAFEGVELKLAHYQMLFINFKNILIEGRFYQL
jgi:hypothetical protein